MKKILIGTIVATSGIKGYVRINTCTETPDDLKLFDVVYNKSDKQYKIKRVVSTKGRIAIVEIVGITSIDEAQKLVGYELFTNRDTFDSLYDNSYYYIDLIGSKVYIGEIEYGEVVDVMNYGASDIIEIREIETAKLAMYPFTDDFIMKVDLEKQMIVLKEKIVL